MCHYTSARHPPYGNPLIPLGARHRITVLWLWGLCVWVPTGYLVSRTNQEVLERCDEVLTGASHRFGDGEGSWCVPNNTVYPHQWLWDSCFHAIALCALGRHDEAVSEMEFLFDGMSPEGFLPHMVHHSDPDAALVLWRQPKTSDITQPPMYGHALRVIRDSLPVGDPLHERVDVLVGRSEVALEWLLRHRRWFEPEPLVVICHPWETGCDDSLRWDGWMPDGVYNREKWGVLKKRWVKECLDFGEPGYGNGDFGAVSNREFGVMDAGFNGLVAFNASELVAAGGSRHFELVALELGGSLEKLFRVETGTFDSLPVFPDVDPYASLSGDGVWDGRRWWWSSDASRYRQETLRRPTLDAVLPALVVDAPQLRQVVVDGLVDERRFGAEFGPAGAHRNTPGYEPSVYWRGCAWPQLSYLCWVLARRVGREDVAATISGGMVAAVMKNGFAEYWHPDTGEGGGAAPQTWSTVVAATL